MTALEILRNGGNFRGYARVPLRPVAAEEELLAARGVAQRTANFLKSHFGASRVVLYGSLARGDSFDENSDIDLAAWGIPDDLCFAAIAGLDKLDSRWTISLLTNPSDQGMIAESIKRDGVDL